MIDPKKQYKTRDGREVRIYAVDGAGSYPIHGAFFNEVGWAGSAWCRDGKYAAGMTHSYDLIEVKPRIKREVWVNVYPDDVGVPCNSKNEADQVWRLSGRIACVKLTIDCEEGEGL